MTDAVPPPRTRVLSPEDWRERQTAHEARVEPWIAPRLARRREGRKHPVDDFLFEYYSFSPAKLSRWHPGYLLGLTGSDLSEVPGFVRDADGVTRVEADLWHRRLPAAEHALALMRATAARPPRIGCSALHEWAMVYRIPADRIRHTAWPLRLGATEVAGVVEGGGLRCTHFDAFRFFTDAARPLNPTPLSRADQIDREQPGCLHATMDLYRWAYSLYPLLPAEVVADCFALARSARHLDMRASPYDLRDLGLHPIEVETVEGARQFAGEQETLARRGAAQRTILIEQIATVYPHLRL